LAARFSTSYQPWFWPSRKGIELQEVHESLRASIIGVYLSDCGAVTGPIHDGQKQVVLANLHHESLQQIKASRSKSCVLRQALFLAEAPMDADPELLFLKTASPLIHFYRLLWSWPTTSPFATKLNDHVREGNNLSFSSHSTLKLCFLCKEKLKL
jgi:hypothetical protein